jgi:hypothetical protein
LAGLVGAHEKGVDYVEGAGDLYLDGLCSAFHHFDEVHEYATFGVYAVAFVNFVFVEYA